MATSDPLREYRARLAGFQDSAQRLTVVYGRIALARLVVAVAFVAMSWISLVERWTTGFWLLAPVGAFIALAVVHSRIAQRQERVSRGIAFYELGIARIEDRWAGLGQNEMSMARDDHLYAADLDIFGSGSLFELISTARTRTGRETLARWLQEPAAPAEIVARQQAVEELRPMLVLREDLAMLGSRVVDSVDPDSVREWGEAPDSLRSLWPRIAAPILALITTAGVVVVVARDTREAWLSLLVLLGVEGVFVLLFRARVDAVLAGADRHSREFEFLSELIRRVEARSFTSEKLRGLQRAIETGGKSPSAQLTGFARLCNLADMRRNIAYWLVAFLMVMTQVAFALEAWRRVCGPALAGWLSAIGEFEALLALAGYAYEHPSDPFPEIVEQGPVFVGRDLAHPLIPAAVSVANDVALGAEPQMLVVSGSNMSGKSTLLRTVGVNAVLALAGAPVRAASLRLSPLAVGATLRIQDSLQQGTSRFYAEIQRIREIVGRASERPPVLFLLDEVLHGTNSHDRARGADGILRGLLERGAIGLATTHDLALTGIADDLGARVSNVHFEDRLEGDRMIFDYRMRSGVVEKSNALELMRALGLDV